MNTASKVFRTVFTHSLFFVSEISLVRFLIQKQLVCKYRTPALSMKYSLYIRAWLDLWAYQRK